MQQVAAYFRSTKSPLEPNGSIRDTAIKFDINRNKVRKILITMGEIESPITEAAFLMRKQGMTVKEIAKELGVSTATVSTALPYEDKVDNTLDPTEHALDVRGYRAYQRKQQSRQAGRASKKQDAHAFLKGDIRSEQSIDQKGSQNLLLTRGSLEDEKAGMKVLRLHMELYDEYADDLIDEEDAAVFRKYGGLEHGKSISRDVIVPGDIPLYAIHYVIQKAFGWQNSHLHQFELPEERFCALTNHNASMWNSLVGILFRSPFMDEADEFWADDYKGGSFKNWLRRKYTGPYLSHCYGEGIISCRKDLKELDMNEDYYVMYSKAYNPGSQKYDGEEYVSGITPVYDYNGNRRPEPKPWRSDEIPYRVEVMKLADVPAEGLRFVFERNPMALLERLPLDSILAAGRHTLSDDCSEEVRKYIDEQITGCGSDLYMKLEKDIKSIISEQIDSPNMQVKPMPVTDILLYNYDFGDNWKIRITASKDCTDLLDSGRITRAELSKANRKCREMYRPVLIARDGEMLIDDVGGIHGFADFLRRVNPELKNMDQEEKEEAEQMKREYLEWAESLGWHREKTSNYNLL